MQKLRVRSVIELKAFMLHTALLPSFNPNYHFSLVSIHNDDDTWHSTIDYMHV